ncbi:hypothetical protein AAFC00_000539 [Neodothiora populina]|uniref:Patatin-like phospholipase domain-containing protein n=1 Tax=Neodothiora populina TaxID=2781224 RepID=A0ABR3PD74_9PEZI
MDFLLRDVYLPGLAHEGRLNDNSTLSASSSSTVATRPSHNSHGSNNTTSNSTILPQPASLLKLLRGPQTSRNSAAGASQPQGTRASTAIGSGSWLGSERLDASAIDGPGTDNEWQKQVLRLKVQQAKCYADWLAASSELDVLENNNAWKNEEESTEYNAPLVRARMEQLEEARINCDASRMLFLVRTTLTRNLGGMGDICLYKHSRVGTKARIEAYIEAALDTLEAVVDLSSPSKTRPSLDTRDVYEQLLRTRQAFGRSALLLSGGGTLGMNHIGVAKSLFEAQLLPRIVSGASAGSIVAAVLCTRTDDEIPQLLRDFCYGDLDVFEKDGEDEGVWKKAFRFLTDGALFDISNLIRVMRDLLGDLTFQEAYNRTRRILNICVSTASLYELPRLLNYVTAPNVMIWSAVATSCSVPFIFSPAQLLAKDPRTGEEVPWDHSPQRWIDGSVDNDLPMTRLAEMFNVNHFIVSQVNPHVVPFLDKDDTFPTSAPDRVVKPLAPSSTWLRTLAELAKGEALHRMQVLAELGVMPTTMSKVRSVLSQRYSGDITILPEVSYAQFPKVLRNPTTDFMIGAMLSGERATWPKLSQVRNHCAIELALDGAVQRVRTRLVFSPSQIDLRLSAFARSDVPNLSGPGKRRQKKRRASHDSSPPPDPRLFLTVPRGSRPYSASMHDRFAIKLAGSEAGSASSGIETGPSSTADDVEYSEDIPSSSSLDSPPSPRPQITLWPTSRLLFPSVSQPSTPSAAPRGFSHFTSLSPQAPASSTASSTTSQTGPSEPEKKYKQMFHRSRLGESPTIRPELVDATAESAAFDEDISGTRGMVHRKRSLSTGLKGIWPPKAR